MAKQETCPNCGKLFTPWRKKAYCSERCRKAAQNVRLGYVRRDGATPLPDKAKSENLRQRDQRLTNLFRRDEGFEWTACNDVTQKLTREGSPDAVGWATRIGGDWYGRIGKDFSFGPTSLARARKIVEARLLGHPFDKFEGEKSWSGDCWGILHPAA